MSKPKLGSQELLCGEEVSRDTGKGKWAVDFSSPEADAVRDLCYNKFRQPE